MTCYTSWFVAFVTAWFHGANVRKKIQRQPVINHHMNTDILPFIDLSSCGYHYHSNSAKKH